MLSYSNPNFVCTLMKIKTKYFAGFSFKLDEWLKDYTPIKIPKESDGIVYWAYEVYLEKCDEFRSFLNSKEDVTDEYGNKLTPIQILNAIEDYKIMIRKLILIINLRLYKAYNIKKETKIKYIVMRAYWLDNEGKPFRNFSKNLGAEQKILVNGKIPHHLLDSAEEFILDLMWDLWHIEYVADGEYQKDENGDLRPL